jgi:hypothetical protein
MVPELLSNTSLVFHASPLISASDPKALFLIGEHQISSELGRSLIEFPWNKSRISLNHAQIRSKTFSSNRVRRPIKCKILLNATVGSADVNSVDPGKP